MYVLSTALKLFLNEYVFFQSDEEVKLITNLEKKLLNNLENNEIKIAILGSYIPLHKSENIKKSY